MINHLLYISRDREFAEDPAFFMTSVVLRNSRIGELAAEVLWRQDGEMGLRFADDPETVAEIIGRTLK